MSKADMGKVMVTPKGEYAAAIQYERLDIVRDGNSVYLSKKNVKGVAPGSDANKWMKLLDGSVTNAVADAAAIYGETSSAEVSHFTGAAKNAPITLQTDIEPIQTTNGYNSPWPGKQGKNLLVYPYFQGSRTVNGVTFTVNDDGSITVSTEEGGATQSTDLYIIGSDSNVIVGNGNYKMALSSNGGTITNGSAYLHLTPNRGDGTMNCQSGNNAAFTITSDKIYILTLRVTNGAVIEGVTYYPLICAGDTTDFTWEPYQNTWPISGWPGANVYVSSLADFSDKTTYEVSFPAEAGTVYGGTLKVGKDGTAVLTVDRVAIDLGELNYSYSSTNQYFYGTGQDVYIVPDGRNTLPDMMCSILPICTHNQIVDGVKQYGISLSVATEKRILVRCNEYDDPAELKTALAGQIAVARLATPKVYEFSTPPILTLFGENYISSNTGDVAVEYIMDTKTYIDNKIAAMLNA